MFLNIIKEKKINYNELKDYCLKKVKDYPEVKKRLGSELFRAKIAYDNGLNLVEDLIKNKNKITNGVIPFLLSLTSDVDLKKPIELKQVRYGGGGGLDRILFK